jgi:hypothetical protein
MTLLPWPALPPLVTGLSVHLQRELTIYERARADAALQRLRVAVEALQSLGQGLGCKRGDSVVSVGELLTAIGDLPHD